MEFSLETSGSSLFTPSDGNQDTFKRDKRRKNPSTLRRDKKRSDLRRAQMAGPSGGGGALRDVQENEHANQNGVSPNPSDLAARTKTAESKNKRKNRKRRGKASATSNSLELQVDRAAPKNCESTRSVPNEKLKNSSILGTEMSKGAPEEPLDPPVHWDSDTSLWDYVVEQGLALRDPYRDLVALNKEIEAKTGPESEVMREFWAALSLCITVFSRQDGLHLGFRRGVGSFGNDAPGGSLWTVEQVDTLGGVLWEEKPRFFRDILGEVLPVSTQRARSSMFSVRRLASGLGTRPLGPTLGISS